MKKVWLVLVVLLSSGALLAACGGDGGDGPLNQEDLVAAADDVCSERAKEFEDLGVRGLTNAGIAAEFEGTAAVRQAFVDDFEELETDGSVSGEWAEYIKLTQEIVASDKAISAAANKDDDAAVGAAFEAQNALYEKRDKLAEELGFEVCGQVSEVEIEESGTGPADDLAFAEPGNTVEGAAGAYLKAASNGDCVAFNAARHTDAGEVDQVGCENGAAALKGGEVVATESYGPVGMAEIVGADDVHYPTYFVTDLDGDLKYGGDTINDAGGLRPAAEGDDADETAAALVTAIRDGDADGLNATVADPENSVFKTEKDDFDSLGGGKFAKSFVSDLRGSDAVAEPLGINATYAFYFVPGNDYDWVVSLVHSPGAGNEYRFSGFYPVPKRNSAVDTG